MSTYPKVVPQDLEDEIAKEEFHVLPGTRTTVCQITTQTGFTTTGLNHGPVHALNFDAELGKTYSRKGAVEQLWPLLGFRLRDKLSLIEKAGAPTGKITELGDPRTAVGTKVVHFIAMTLGDYNTYRGWGMPLNEDPEANGYLVEYTDGGKPNMDGHAGYVSWSPADVFEKSYGVSVRQEPETFLDRMIKERDELLEKFTKGMAFFKSPGIDKIPTEEKQDLGLQLNVMHEYLFILNRRISRNSK